MNTHEHYQRSELGGLIVPLPIPSDAKQCDWCRSILDYYGYSEQRQA